MKIDFAMLTVKDTRKLRLMSFITDHHGQFNLVDFATNMQGSYSQAYHILLNLRTDLQHLAPTTKLTKDSLTTPITVDVYRHWLYARSIPYQAVLATLSAEPQQVRTLCERYGISTSTFNRRMRPMRQQLAQYHLELTTNPLRLNGDETLVQLLYFTLFSTTLTTLNELPELPAAYQSLYEAICTTYADDTLYQNSKGLAQHRNLLITLALLRLAQGHRYSALRFPLVHLTDLRPLAVKFQQQLNDTPRAALTELATLDYLLTSSPYFVRALQPRNMQRLYSGLRQKVPTYQLAPSVASLSDFATGQDWFANWLFSLGQFMLLFRVDPLLRPEITALYRTTPTSTAAATDIANNLAQLYPDQVTASDLRLAQKYLSKYTNGLNLTAARVQILVSYDMLGVTTDIFNRLLGGIVHLSLLTSQVVIDEQKRGNYIVVYGTDPQALRFAQAHQLEAFHWIKELKYGENLDRLIRTLRHHELSIFALDFQNP
ncbi:helix-turn-helix domain-containing protein [Levilactobacillus acidifarinae]|uniref:Mga helix-turn-helix domain-containing protein n=1 Tax=Levilactobacillus acidifarinae DSM 19394 = JCM 15949 TaxID=1423715 RepID=A0A0R1LLE4_9LACO|nr:helix-turn-helix domain-containing protein [Levilactobacillus acidifarinae]KRK96716.1 hypothetical protein FD25_GL001795 [Levilactobacillus acidifarinae DSM 19394]GEO70413.1 hypothetical protein LAC03_23230 [Levilactobacillus acidifarinae]